MNNWQIKKLGEVADILMGQSPPSNTYNTSGTGLPFFQGKADFNDVYPSISKYCSKPVRVAQRDDVLLSVRAPVGPVNLAPSEICIGRGLSAIRGKRNVLNQMYLFYYMKLNELALGKKGTGSTFSSINRRDIEKIDLPLPPLPIQQQIIERLDAIRKLQELNNKEIEKAEELMNSLLAKSFKPQEGWKYKSLGEVLSFEYGKGLPERKRIQGKIPVFGSNGQVGIHNLALVKGPGIIVGRKGSIGEIVWSDSDFWPIDTTYYVKLRTNEDLSFIFFLLRTLNLKKLNKASGVPGLNRNDICELKVSLPPINIQKQIAKYLNTVIEFRERKELEKDKLSELFEYTLNKAMKGELVN